MEENEMKTSNRLSIISAVAALAIVGTGFAAWQFSKDASATSTGNVSITAKAEEAGTLKLADGQTFTLTLDQDFIGWQKKANDDNTSDVSTVKLEYTGSTANDYEGNKAVDEDVTVTMTAEYGALSTYVDFGDLDAAITKDYKGEDKIEFEFNLPTVSYVDSMYPRNEEAYDAMVNAIGSATVNFTFNAEVAQCTH